MACITFFTILFSTWPTNHSKCHKVSIKNNLIIHNRDRRLLQIWEGGLHHKTNPIQMSFVLFVCMNKLLCIVYRVQCAPNRIMAMQEDTHLGVPVPGCLLGF